MTGLGKIPNLLSAIVGRYSFLFKGDDGTIRIRDLLKVYFEQDGMQVQFNVVGTDVLYDAQKNPENHRNLIVRIAGFSAYFVEMPKVLQDDFISRTEQAL